MDNEKASPVSEEEAQASLQEIDRIINQTRKAIASGNLAPQLIIWGVVWILGYGGEQFFPESSWHLWLGLILAGAIGTIFVGPWSRRSPVKGPGYGRNLGRIGLSWLVLFAYGALWVALLSPWEMMHRAGWRAYAPLMDRKVAAFCATFCMFAYVIMGLWLSRFLLWLGVLVTVATLAGYHFLPAYFCLWMAVTGGGSLVVAGVFIRKYWR